MSLLPNVYETCINSIKFIDQLKPSKKQYYTTLLEKIKVIGDAIQNTLSNIDPVFKVMDPNLFHSLTLSQGFLSQTMFKINIPSNAVYALFGDALLDTLLLKAAIDEKLTDTNYTLTQYDMIRIKYTNNESLASIHDQLFQFDTILLLNEHDEQSLRQKATMMEALVGLVGMFYPDDLSHVSDIIFKGLEEELKQ